MFTHFLIRKTILSVFFLISFTLTIDAQIYINEFMASNDVTLTDEVGEFEDWVEVYNAGNTPVNLAGYYWTDDLTELTLSQIPSDNPTATTVPAGGFLLFWFDKDLDQGTIHVNAKLGSGGEDLALVAANGTTIIDSYTFGPQLADVSEGRVPDGGSSFDFYNQPTPNATNDTDPGAATAAKPTVDIAGGLHSGITVVTLSTETEDATIYYTLDGSVPTENSLEYSEPITISQITSLRARTILAPLTASEILTETYLIDVSHTFPIITLAGNPEDFFGANGIVPNYEEDLEIPVNVEFYETDGSLGFNQIVEVEINGTASAVFPQKSFALKAKGSLGDATFSHPIFPNQDRDEYRSLILRNSGNDWAASGFRDAMVTSLTRDISDVGDIIQPPLLNGLDYRPCIAYLNGTYYGMYNLRERPDKRYIRVHYDLDDNEIDLIENLDEVKEGDITEWATLQAEFAVTDYSDAANFAVLASKVDVDQYLDYLVFQLYVDNQDWPGNNNRRFRERTEDGKWRWILYDLDFSFGMFTSQGWNTGYAGDNSLDRMLNPHPYNWPNPEWGSRLFNNLLENEGWRTKFINRMADQINILYQSDRINTRIDDIYASYLPEKDQSNALWGNLWNQENAIDVLKSFGADRIAVVYDDFIEAFDQISGTTDLTINAIPTDKGAVNLSTLHLNEDDFSWTGTYFSGLPVPVVAVPNPGYVLDHWSGVSNETNSSINVLFSGNTANLTAHFELGSTSTAGIVINEINYNSSDLVNSGDWVEFHNPTGESVDISGWYFQDEDGANFVFPNNTILSAGAFLVLVEDMTEFTPSYPNITNVIGNFGSSSIFEKIKLSNGGELLSLFNANGTLIDEVDYDDNAPWVETPDGDGPTLQLMNSSFDNSIAENWAGWNPTPGAENVGEDVILLPQSITFGSLSDKFTSDTPFQISATASSGLTVNFSLVSGPAIINGNTITLTGQTGTVTILATQNGSAVYNAATPVSQSFQVTDIPVAGEYCNSTSEQPWHQWIANVKFGDIDHASAKEAYADFTEFSTTVEKGTLHNMNLTAGFSYFTEVEYWTVWIDYNQNGIFEEPSEITYQVIQEEAPDGTLLDGVAADVLIPADALNGATRMRVSMKKGDFAGPCETFLQGEVEDYTVIITGTTPSSISVNCPDNLIFQAPAGASSAQLTWIPPTATTTCTDTDVTITQIGGPQSGDVIPTNTLILISYQITDNCDNSETCTFSAIVETPSVNLSISCPQNQTIVTTEATAVASWLPPTATGDCQGNLTTTQIAGATNGSAFPLGINTITFQATDNCDNSETCSFIINVEAEVVVGDYCIPNSDFPWHEWIAGVTVADIDNASGKRAYSDFLDIVGNVQQNSSYPITLTTGFSYYTFDENWSVWIDYNQDGTFVESELAYSGTLSAPENGTATMALNGNINIPTTATLGNTRMRVAMSRNDFATPCGPIALGEYEDYTINISPFTQNLTHNPKLFFEAARTGTEVLLNWGTNTEYKNDYFEIEHSFDGQNFSTLLEIESRREETYSMRTYREYDRPDKGTHFYRVKQFALDGSFVYSSLQEIVFDLDKNEMHLFPNPANEIVFISAPSKAGLKANVQLANGLGTVLQTLKFERFPLTPTGLELGDLKPGVYFVSLKVEGFRMITKRVVVTR